MATAVSSKLNNDDEPVFNVVGIDQDNIFGKQRIDMINKGIFPFQTNDSLMRDELKKSVKRGNFFATSDTNYYSKADVILISINCDLIKEAGQKNIAIEPFTSGIKDIARKISENTLVIVESTIPPGMCEKIIYPIFCKYLSKRNIDISKFFLAHSYERVMPGKNYLNSIINFWRVYAGIDVKSADLCENFLSQIINVSKYPLTRLKTITASEIGKLLENSYRAVNIAFMEEWGRFAEELQVDLYEVINAVRVRPTHLNIMEPGFGVGGYCLTKDPLFAKIASNTFLKLGGHDFPFSSLAVKVNSEMPIFSVEKVKEFLGGNLRDKNILLMGVSYRKDVSDTRFSPSQLFFEKANSEGAKISVHDPMVSYWEDLNIKIESELPSAKNFHAIVFAVRHAEYKEISFSNWLNNSNALIFDSNNVLSQKQRDEIGSLSLVYFSVGRGIKHI